MSGLDPSIRQSVIPRPAKRGLLGLMQLSLQRVVSQVLVKGCLGLSGVDPCQKGLDFRLGGVRPSLAARRRCVLPTAQCSYIYGR